MPNYRLTKAFYQFPLQTAVGNSTEVTKQRQSSAERFSSLTQTVWNKRQGTHIILLLQITYMKDCKETEPLISRFM